MAIVISKTTSFTIVAPVPVELEKLDGVRCLVEPGQRDNLIATLKANEVRPLATRWNISYAMVQRIRNALGLTTPETGQSATTLWRRRKAQAQESTSNE